MAPAISASSTRLTVSLTLTTLLLLAGLMAPIPASATRVLSQDRTLACDTSACALILCAPNTICKCGRCVKLPKPPKGDACATQCAATTCPAGSQCQCIRGVAQCVPNSPPEDDSTVCPACLSTTCLEGSQCQCDANGTPQCVPNTLPLLAGSSSSGCDTSACDLIRCGFNTICKCGRCVPPRGGQGNSPPEGSQEVCPACLSTTCLEGSQCQCDANGTPQCIPNTPPAGAGTPACDSSACALILCAPGTTCQCGRCVRSGRGDAPPAGSQLNQEVSQEVCSACLSTTCLEGSQCQCDANGTPQCVPNTPPQDDSTVCAACAATLCLEGSQCQCDASGTPQCVPNTVCSECAGKLCLEGSQCNCIQGVPQCVSNTPPKKGGKEESCPECAVTLCLKGTQCKCRGGKARCVPIPQPKGGH